jgi:hypothetical protein
VCAWCSCYKMNYEAPFFIIFYISCYVQATLCAVLQPLPIGLLLKYHDLYHLTQLMKSNRLEHPSDDPNKILLTIICEENHGHTGLFSATTQDNFTNKIWHSSWEETDVSTMSVEWYDILTGFVSAFGINWSFPHYITVWNFHLLQPPYMQTFLWAVWC